MRALGLALFFLSGLPASAQVPLENPMTEIRNRCIAEAVDNGNVQTDKGQTFYTCAGETAQRWFDLSTEERMVHDKNGVFAARYYGATGYCAHQIEDKSAQPTSAYVCEVVVSKTP